MKEVLLYSGGMDSLIAWHYLDKPQTLYINLGHRYAQKERESILRLLPIPKILQSSYGWYFEREDAHIPGRNLLLGMFAAAEGFDKIWLVAQKGEQNIPDRSPEFFKDTSRILSFHFERDIQFLNPFPDWYKHDMVKWYLDNGFSIEDLVYKSVSCYSADWFQCGQCPSCWRKYVALKYNGIQCEDAFQGDVRTWGRENYYPKLETYDEGRQKVMREVMGW